ncbi:hypothetical protein PoB_005002000 [Plakobranchus ocellatus]|uniref:Uncharacterized protein n=1 Tax=Plakobranchus ocellatus TaxID=259542 RepID=A0AAV4BSU7_9GAST|nr:hypothetical protein PoB_005002000 [Plakobranchus ocellatus]
MLTVSMMVFAWRHGMLATPGTEDLQQNRQRGQKEHPIIKASSQQEDLRLKCLPRQTGVPEAEFEPATERSLHILGRARIDKSE